MNHENPQKSRNRYTQLPSSISTSTQPSSSPVSSILSSSPTVQISRNKTQPPFQEMAECGILSELLSPYFQPPMPLIRHVYSSTRIESIHTRTIGSPERPCLRRQPCPPRHGRHPRVPTPPNLHHGKHPCGRCACTEPVAA